MDDNHDANLLNGLPNECDIKLISNHLNLYHDGINLLSERNKSNHFAFNQLKWMHYLSEYDQIHLLQKY